jgi:hypothetical protein
MNFTQTISSICLNTRRIVKLPRLNVECWKTKYLGTAENKYLGSPYQNNVKWSNVSAFFPEDSDNFLPVNDTIDLRHFIIITQYNGSLLILYNIFIISYLQFYLSIWNRALYFGIVFYINVSFLNKIWWLLWILFCIYTHLFNEVGLIVQSQKTWHPNNC